MTRATRHLQLAIEVDSDPITGSVSNGTHRSQPFSGWIELVAAIEEVRASGHGCGGSEECSAVVGQTLGGFPGAKASGL